jgi:hypothetical protein
MKTAISLPDELFIAAEQQAKRTRKSRSQLYAEALAEYLARHAPDEVTEAMNRVVERLDEPRPDPLLAAAALQPAAPVIAWQADLFVTADMFRALAAHPAPNVLTLGRGDARESPRLRASLAGDRLTRVWDGESEWLDIGAWKLAPAVLAGMRRVRAEKGEYRMLPNLQLALDAGASVGYTMGDAWIHLGGEFPTPEANVRDVVQRVWGASDALERG